MRNFKHSLLVWIVYALLAFPSFYFVYKFGSPYFGTNDYFDYYKLYKDWDVKNVDAPFNMRLVSSFFVHILYKLGFHYDTKIIFESPVYEKEVYFSAVFFNFICVVSTCLVLFITSKKYFQSNLLSFSSGVLYLLGFGTLFYELMPMTDAFSILIFSVVYLLYLDKSIMIIIPLFILVLQREYIYMALGLVALCDWFKLRENYYVKVIIACIFFFLTYYLLRKTVFYTPKYDHQASGSFFIDSILTTKFPILPYIKQTLMTLNIFILYIGIVAYKILNKINIDKHNFFIALLLFLQINVISFAAVFGNNTGRYFYIVVPFIIFQIIKESKQLLRIHEA